MSKPLHKSQADNARNHNRPSQDTDTIRCRTARHSLARSSSIGCSTARSIAGCNSVAQYLPADDVLRHICQNDHAQLVRFSIECGSVARGIRIAQDPSVRITAVETGGSVRSRAITKS